MSDVKSIGRRQFLKSSLATGLACGTILAAPAILAKTRKYAGVTLNGAGFSHPFTAFINKVTPEFEDLTGIKINLSEQAFGVYNQQMDLELSTGGTALDFGTITFIYSGRWIGAGWLHPLDEFASRPNSLGQMFDPGDFASGAQAPLRDKNGATYGYSFEGGAMIMAASRADIIDEAGLSMPTNFDELLSTLQAIHNKQGVAGYVASSLHHWNWIPYLMGFGGKVFEAPPENLLPAFDTAEAAEAIEYYARILSELSPEGVLSYNFPQAKEAGLTGRANIQCQALSWLTPMSADPASTVKDTVRYALMPGGPAGAFPGSNSQGIGIPTGSKNKEAAWEFISWILSKANVERLALDEGFAAVTRTSVINSGRFRQNMTFNGTDVAKLYLEVLNKGGEAGYMKYRTVPVFPQVGGTLNKAVEAVASGQASGASALAKAKKDAIINLRKAGIRL